MIADDDRSWGGASTLRSGPMADGEMNPAIRSALELGGDRDRLKAYYAEWADSYDDDIGEGNAVPAGILATLAEAIGALDDPSSFDPATARVLDAGCGTGLLGVALADAGYHDLHGVDLSEAMVARARDRGVYRTLEGDMDLTDPPAHLAGAADIVTLSGVFSVGHVPPSALAGIVGLVRPGGLVVASARRAYLEETDFDATQTTLAEQGVVDLLAHNADWPYTSDSTGDYYAWQRR